MMVIKLEKNRKVIKSWEFDKADDKLEKSILESLDADYEIIKSFRDRSQGFIKETVKK
jgi:hypothetical protein